LSVPRMIARADQKEEEDSTSLLGPDPGLELKPTQWHVLGGYEE